MICYALTAGTIIGGRGYGEGHELLRADTTLRDKTKKELKHASDLICLFAFDFQCAFSIRLLYAALYTHAIQILFRNGFGILRGIFFCVAYPLCRVIAAIILLAMWQFRVDLWIRILGIWQFFAIVGILIPNLTTYYDDLGASFQVRSRTLYEKCLRPMDSLAYGYMQP